MNSTSPPTAVNASPVATPGSDVRLRTSPENRRGPSQLRARRSSIRSVFAFVFPSATWRAALRSTAAICRSRLLTPASRVYPRIVRRIAAEVGAHLVDLVDQEHRVQRLGVADRADDRPRHGADVRAPVAADLRLVADAADRQPLELAAEGARDRLAERRLADAGRADEA